MGHLRPRNRHSPWRVWRCSPRPSRLVSVPSVPQPPAQGPDSLITNIPAALSLPLSLNTHSAAQNQGDFPGLCGQGGAPIRGRGARHGPGNPCAKVGVSRLEGWQGKEL